MTFEFNFVWKRFKTVSDHNSDLNITFLIRSLFSLDFLKDLYINLSKGAVCLAVTNFPYDLCPLTNN